jgi:CDP-diacylglycerol--glycerol-3-phosphate 3-phosphatidyltransferase
LLVDCSGFRFGANPQATITNIPLHPLISFAISLLDEIVPNNQTIWNIPNQLSAARVVLAIVSFVTLEFDWYITTLVLFSVATITDYVDGWWARRYGLVTQLGRIIDPFADKLLVCGLLIMLVAIADSLVAAWMAVVVVARELLVTVLRSLCEGRDLDFSAQWAGKWKMAFQCLSIILVLVRLSLADSWQAEWFDKLIVASLWLTVASTLYSGWGYVRLAANMLSEPS